MKAGQDGEGGVGHVQVLQAVLQPLEDGGRDHLEGVVGERQVDQGGGAAECLLINLVDGVERQVEVHNVLYLVEERIRDKFDLVPSQVQVFQTALHWVQGFHWDFVKFVESHPENFQSGLAEDTLWEVFNVVEGEIQHSQVLLPAQH